MGTVLLFSPSGALTTKEIFESIEAEIERLKEVKQLLGGEGTGTKGGRKPKAVTKTVGKRTMSAEDRARIAAAQKARWAKKKKT